MSYRSELIEAFARTARFGLTTPHLETSSTRYLTDNNLARVLASIESTYGRPKLEELVAQCLFVHLRARPIVESVLGLPVYFTLGHYYSPPNYHFQQTEGSLASMMKNRALCGGTLDLHAWLTLPSDEILDLSIATTLAVINKLDIGYGAIIATHADDLGNGVSYHPMLVGEEFLMRIGAMALVVVPD